MKIKLISGKRLPRYAVICANFAVVDNFPIGDFHKLQNGQTVKVDALIGDQLIAGGWCEIVPELLAQEETTENNINLPGGPGEEGE